MTDTVEPRVAQRPASMKSAKLANWLVVETLGRWSDEEPTLVAEGGAPKEFTSLRNRKWSIARSPSEGAEISKLAKLLVEAVAVTGKEQVELITIASKAQGDIRARMAGHPILSARGEVFGVELWVGDARQPVPARRPVGAFEWDYRTQTTEHGPGAEDRVMGTDPAVERGVQDVWKFFGGFERLNEYEDYVKDFAIGAKPPGAPFASKVTVRGAQPRLTYMATRTRETAEGKKIAGVIHDITSAENRPKQDFSLDALRTAARLIAESSPDPVGVCQLTLATGIFLEWYHNPPGSLSRWATEVPEIHEKSIPVLEQARIDLRKGKVTRTDVALFLRFAGDEEWTPADLTITATEEADPARGVEARQGIVQARPGTGPLCW